MGMMILMVITVYQLHSFLSYLGFSIPIVIEDAFNNNNNASTMTATNSNSNSSRSSSSSSGKGGSKKGKGTSKGGKL